MFIVFKILILLDNLYNEKVTIYNHFSYVHPFFRCICNTIDVGCCIQLSNYKWWCLNMEKLSIDL